MRAPSTKCLCAQVRPRDGFCSRSRREYLSVPSPTLGSCAVANGAASQDPVESLPGKVPGPPHPPYPRLGPGLTALSALKGGELGRE